MSVRGRERGLKRERGREQQAGPFYLLAFDSLHSL